MAHQSRSAVVAAIVGNGILTALKFGAAFLTHSASMMNEAVHSLMDTANQVFLLMGLIRGSRPADRTYAFGHGQKKYLWNLWSAIGLFSIGSGLGLAHAWHSWHAIGEREVPASISLGGLTLDPIWVSAAVLLIALLVEGYVLTVAWRKGRPAWPVTWRGPRTRRWWPCSWKTRWRSPAWCWQRSASAWRA